MLSCTTATTRVRAWSRAGHHPSCASTTSASTAAVSRGGDREREVARHAVRDGGTRTGPARRGQRRLDFGADLLCRRAAGAEAAAARWGERGRNLARHTEPRLRPLDDRVGDRDGADQTAGVVVARTFVHLGGRP